MKDASTARSEFPERHRATARLLVVAARRVELPLVALWFALAAGLAAITVHVVDWYVMTDELLYERLAISIAHSRSPLPRVHGELIANINQLYPLLLAPLFHDHLVPTALREAHVLNAIVMSSSCVPVFLLARRVTERRLLSYLIAGLSVLVPWIVLSSFLLTEVVAYPVFLWAVLALQHAAVSPRRRNDVLALLALGVATLARTQFAALFVVLPFALVIHQLSLAELVPRSRRRRLRAAAAELLSAHRILASAYAVFVIVAILLISAGRFSSALGTYSVTAEGNLLPSGIGRSLLEHLATLGLGIAILPFVVGVAWLLTALVGTQTRERHAFASIATLTITVLLLEVSSYDLRFGGGRVHDRYLFYVVPLILVGLAAALSEGSWPRWSLFVPAGLLAMGFAYAPVKRYEKFNVDSPVSVLNDGLRDLGGSVRGAQLLLGLATIVLTMLFLQATVLLRRAHLAALLIGITMLALPSETGLAFSRLFAVDGTSGRPLTLDQGVVFDWIDRTLGPDRNVTMIPYPTQYGDYWASVAYSWNDEFWNASVQRSAVYGAAFSWTPDTFPKTNLRFDPATGRTNVSPSEYVTEALGETRFHISGTQEAEARGVVLLHTEKPWRAEWMTFGLYHDGWTRPNVLARIRVFATPEQTEPEVRYLTISARTPDDIKARSFRVSSNVRESEGKATVAGRSMQIGVCVPERGFADVSLSSPSYSPIYGEPLTAETFANYARSGGILLTDVALADEKSRC